MTTITDGVGHPDDVSLRERKKQHTRQAIHEAALRLVDEHGLDSTTVEQICEAADVSQRTFFNYYPSKPAAALDLPENLVSEEAAIRFRAAEGRLVPALCDLLGTTVGSARHRARLKALIAKRSELSPVFGRWIEATRGQMVELARERARSDEEAAAAVALVMAALGLAVHRRDDARADDESELLREMVEGLVSVSTAPLTPRA